MKPVSSGDGAMSGPLLAGGIGFGSLRGDTDLLLADLKDKLR
jgi:hypothetical protein